MNTAFSAVFPVVCYLLALAVVGVLIGVRLARVPSFSHLLLPFSGGVLGGVALFWIVPEIIERSGWRTAMIGLAGGFGLLWLVDRYLHAICPSCSHTHEHEGCLNRLHGFALPLLAASGLHSFFDGWSLAVAQTAGDEQLRTAFLIGIGIHKLPEALAMGVLLHAALGSMSRAAVGAILAQCAMLAGAAAAVLLAGELGSNWTGLLLAAAGGAFVYLAFHAIEAEYQSRGMTPTVLPAVTGAVGAAALKTILPG